MANRYEVILTEIIHAKRVTLQIKDIELVRHILNMSANKSITKI